MGRIGFCIGIVKADRLFIYGGREIADIYRKHKVVGVLFPIGNS